MKTIAIYKSKGGAIIGFDFSFADKTVEEARNALNDECKKYWLINNTFEVLEISDFLFEFIRYCLREKEALTTRRLDKPESVKLEEARKRIEELEAYISSCLFELKELRAKINNIICSYEEDYVLR